MELTKPTSDFHLCRYDRLFAIAMNCLALLVPFIIYLRTLAPTVYALDSAELTTGAYTLGIVHAPGSPLYMLIGHIFTRLPFGDVGYRMNLLSACSSALAVFLLYKLLLLVTGSRGIALGTAWTLAFSYYFWISALTAELYAPLACLGVACLYLAYLWWKHGQEWQLYTLALLFGLGLGNHAALVLWLPGLAFITLSRPDVLHRPRLALTAALFGLLGLSVYAYLPLRYLSDTPLNYARDYWNINLASWDGFWWMVTGRMFKELFWAVPLAQIPDEMLLFFDRLWSNFLGLGLILGISGFILLGARFWTTRGWVVGRRVMFLPAPSALSEKSAYSESIIRLNIALGLIFLFNLIFYLPYRAGDKEVMFLPAYIICGIWIGLGGMLIRSLVVEYNGQFYAGLVPLALFVLAGGALWINFPLVDLSQDWSARQVGQQILDCVEPEALYLGTWIDAPVVEYLQIVEGQRDDITVRNMVFQTPQYSRKLAREHLAAGNPVYTSHKASLGAGNLVFEKMVNCGFTRIYSRP